MKTKHLTPEKYNKVLISFDVDDLKNFRYTDFTYMLEKLTLSSRHIPDFIYDNISDTILEHCLRIISKLGLKGYLYLVCVYDSDGFLLQVYEIYNIADSPEELEEVITELWSDMINTCRNWSTEHNTGTEYRFCVYDY